MSDKVSAVPPLPLNTIRHTADFHASVWGDHFLEYTLKFKTLDTKTTQEQYEEMKEEVRRMVMDMAEDNPAKKLQLIDAIQRLGVAYHFEKEIKDALEKLYHDSDNNDKYNDLLTVSLHFRLLRQEGIKISCDVFENFKDEEGKFKASLINDVQGILSLYEAANFAVHGEDILDEALTFTTTQLKTMLSHVSPDHLVQQIKHSLKHPLRKGLPRLEARFFMSSVYPRDDYHSENLLRFAKLDFNVLQALHQKELNDMLQWRGEILNFTTSLPYARDRLVEEYFWAMGIVFEPQYAYSVKNLTKVICILTLIDDTYDAYGTYEELKLFTEAVKRWDIGATEILPEYMKLIYKALFDLFDEIEEDMAKEGKPYCTLHAKIWMQKCVEAYFDEAKWFNEGYVPTYEEYMTVSVETACCEMLTLSSFLGMGDIATEEAFEWVGTNPKIIKASKLIGRLLGDKASHKFEQQREHIASAVECYMKQHGVCEEEAIKVINEQVVSSWKDVNEELLKPTAVPRTLLERVLNYSRVVELLYMDDRDSFTDSQRLKDYIASLLRDPVL